MHTTLRRRLPAALLLLVLLVASCGGDGTVETSSTDSTVAAPPVIDPGDDGDYRPDVDPADFVEVIDNPYLPLRPGSSWVYEDTTGDQIERIEVVVTPDRREVMGISAVIVRDTVTVDGDVVEDTHDWFAQDVDGNVWYLGEDTAEYDNGQVVSTHGSWEAGVDGALPGIIMLANPQVGDAYRQEYHLGEAEDLAQVVRVGQRAQSPFGQFSEVVVIEEWNPFEPETVEEKHYAPGIGAVLEVTTAGGDGQVELVDHVPGS